jgi:hypothetical protein
VNQYQPIPDYYRARGRQCRDIVRDFISDRPGLIAANEADLLEYLYRYPFKHPTPDRDLEKLVEVAALLLLEHTSREHLSQYLIDLANKHVRP